MHDLLCLVVACLAQFGIMSQDCATDQPFLNKKRQVLNPRSLGIFDNSPMKKIRLIILSHSAGIDISCWNVALVAQG
jgi:hypothetical protein